MSNDLNELQVVIPIPSYIPRARGIHSTTQLGSNIKTRVTKNERELIEEEADRLGIKCGAFMRWCAVHAALALRKTRGETNDIPTSFDIDDTGS